MESLGRLRHPTVFLVCSTILIPNCTCGRSRVGDFRNNREADSRPSLAEPPAVQATQSTLRSCAKALSEAPRKALAHRDRTPYSNTAARRSRHGTPKLTRQYHGGPLPYFLHDRREELRISEPCARTIRRARRNRVSRLEHADVGCPLGTPFSLPLLYPPLTFFQYYFFSLVIPFVVLAPYMSQSRWANTFLIPNQHRNISPVW